MKHLMKLFLIVACFAAIKPLNNNLYAAVPMVESKKTVTEELYDAQLLKNIEDSLKLIDPRNSIDPEISSFVEGRVFFGVKIYSSILKGDQENVTIGKKGRKKNRCIKNAFSLAKIITRCAYKQDNVFVGVKYVEKNDDRTFLGTIYNVSKPNSPCKFAFTFFDEVGTVDRLFNHI